MRKRNAASSRQRWSHGGQVRHQAPGRQKRPRFEGTPKLESRTPLIAVSWRRLHLLSSLSRQWGSIGGALVPLQDNDVGLVRFLAQNRTLMPTGASNDSPQFLARNVEPVEPFSGLM